jgi:hypothetical protein
VASGTVRHDGSGSAVFRNVIDQARKQLLLDYEKAADFDHSTIRGGERAAAIAKFLRGRLPDVFAVGKGEIMDREDRRSGELDLIIYDRLTVSPVTEGYDSVLIPCEAVYAIIEAKSTFTRAEAKMTLNAAGKIRRLRPFGQRFISARQDGRPASDDEHRCMYLVFAFRSDLSENSWMEKEFRRLAEVAKEENIDLSFVDRLFVMERGLINPSARKGKEISDEAAIIFAELFLNLTNFLERERSRRPPLSWQSYALPQSRGWCDLK